MDQTTNPLQKIFDPLFQDNNFSFHFPQENSQPLENLSFSAVNDFKDIDKNQFFAQSPDPFKKSRKNACQIHINQKMKTIKSQDFSVNKKLNFDEQESAFKWFNQQKQSQIFCSEISFSPRKRDFFEFSNRNIHLYDEEQIIQTQQKSNKNLRGLKNLSFKVYEIVQKYQRMTFNKVSEILLGDWREKLQKEKNKLSEREEKNIKRRVYDALNVMIASEVIIKKDKFVSLNKSSKNREPCKSPSRMKSGFKCLRFDCFQQLLQEMELKQNNISLKKDQMNSLMEQKQHIDKFFEDKKFNEQQPKVKEKIFFPFLCIRTDEQNFSGVKLNGTQQSRSIWEKQNSSTCDHYNTDENCIFLNFKSKQYLPDIEGDIDFISEVGKDIHKCQKTVLSTEIQSLYISDQSQLHNQKGFRGKKVPHSR